MSSGAANFSHPERLRTPWAARNMLAHIRTAIAQAEFIKWDSLAESFRLDETRLLKHMERKRWRVTK